MIRQPPRSTLFPSRRSPISGFGLSGPYKDLPAMDLTIQAMSGIMNATGFPDRPPVKAGPAVCDFLGDRKSTRLNSSHSQISYAVFCLQKKKIQLSVINVLFS